MKQTRSYLGQELIRLAGGIPEARRILFEERALFYRENAFKPINRQSNEIKVLKRAIARLTPNT